MGGPYRIEQADETWISFSGRLDAAVAAYFNHKGGTVTFYGSIDRLSGSVRAAAIADGGERDLVWLYDLSCSPAKPRF